MYLGSNLTNQLMILNMQNPLLKCVERTEYAKSIENVGWESYLKDELQSRTKGREAFSLPSCCDSFLAK